MFSERRYGAADEKGKPMTTPDPRQIGCGGWTPQNQPAKEKAEDRSALVLRLQNLRNTMNPTTITQMMATLSALGAPPEIDNPTDFARMSQEAQDAVVNAMMGEYDDGPPDLPESVKDEIRAWAALSPENDRGVSVG